MTVCLKLAEITEMIQSDYNVIFKNHSYHFYQQPLTVGVFNLSDQKLGSYAELPISKDLKGQQ